MTDLEMCLLCAEVMGEPESVVHADGILKYWPLTDDAQFAALVKRLRLRISPTPTDWVVEGWNAEYRDADLNRAGVTVAALMQSKATAKGEDR